MGTAPVTSPGVYFSGQSVREQLQAVYIYRVPQRYLVYGGDH
jgi:hypothetical protein